jgi:hypothetical protein
MSAPTADILADMRDALAAAGVFAAVTIGPDADSARSPRAEVLLADLEQARPDDRPEGRWLALRARVRIVVHHPDARGALERALELAQAAEEALLADPSRGGRCQDLPTGPSTEIGPAKVEPGTRPPYLAMSLEVCCRLES